MLKRLLTACMALCLTLLSLITFSQGHKLDFKIEGLANETIMLGYFFGESTYVKDTTVMNAKGEFTFAGTEPLDPGMYFIIKEKSRLFDFVINKDQEFKMTTKHPEYIANLQVEGDYDNDLFVKDLLYNGARNKEADPFVTIVQDAGASEEAKAEARKSLDQINEKVIAYQEKVITEHPESIISTIFKAYKRLDVPEAPKRSDGTVDSTYSFFYYKDHFWDNFDLGDPVLIRLAQPVYRKKVEEYLDNLFLQHPDTISNAIYQLAGVAKKNNDTYKYLVWSATIKYQNPEIMGMDVVFVNLYDKYFASGEMDFWANDQLKQNLKERADQLRLSMIGNKAPNLIMLDDKLQSQSMYDIKNKYTLIYFYDPDCGHCKKETPKLKKFYDETDFDVEVFAVSADTSMTKMRDYIGELKLEWISVNGPRTYVGPYSKLYDALTTPTLYVLDEKKKIIAKKIPAERLEEFLARYEKYNK
ncbi:MAG: redoxin domain-containing protein [Bacteroidota bacterium]